MAFVNVEPLEGAIWEFAEATRLLEAAKRSDVPYGWPMALEAWSSALRELFRQLRIVQAGGPEGVSHD